jgi:hypothetical protein
MAQQAAPLQFPIVDDPFCLAFTALNRFWLNQLDTAGDTEHILDLFLDPPGK